MTSPRSRRLLLPALLAIALLTAAAPAVASCRSSHCGVDIAPPVACDARAIARTPLVLLTGSFGSFRYEPSEPRIEPGDCVEWSAGTITHSSTADNCADLTTTACDAGVPDPACRWETGNVAVGGPSVFCHYDALDFLANSTEGFYCRPHSSPAHTGTMFGTLRVTRAIVLTVTKSASNLLLEWSGGDGGGVTMAQRRFKVQRSTGDPSFSGLIESFVPAGGVGGTSFIDTGEAANTSLNRFYLVQHRQTSE